MMAGCGGRVCLQRSGTSRGCPSMLPQCRPLTIGANEQHHHLGLQAGRVCSSTGQSQMAGTWTQHRQVPLHRCTAPCTAWLAPWPANQCSSLFSHLVLQRRLAVAQAPQQVGGLVAANGHGPRPPLAVVARKHVGHAWWGVGRALGMVAANGHAWGWRAPGKRNGVHLSCPITASLAPPAHPPAHPYTHLRSAPGRGRSSSGLRPPTPR